jgi:hypothetical protein
MKIAILITGHVRNFLKTYPSFLENILYLRQENDVDIIIDTWDVSDSNYTVANKYYPSEEARIDENKIRELYNPISFNIENFESIKDKFAAEKFFPENILRNLYIENQRREKDSSGGRILFKDGYFLLAPQFYKFKQANEKRKQIETQTGIKYDLIIRTRFDVRFIQKFIIPNDLNTLFFSLEYNDFFVCGNDKNMNIFCGIFDELYRISSTHETHPFPWHSDFHMYSAEYFQEWNLLDSGITLDKRQYPVNGPWLCEIERMYN